MRVTWLADVLRAAGLVVHEEAHWKGRGTPFADGLHLRGLVGHHTASSASSGAAPSLHTCIYGRPDLDGPLCQCLLGRDAAWYVIADGKANHAGDGAYPGWPSSANSNALAVEVENNGLGTETWSSAVMHSLTVGSAAILEHLDRLSSDWIAHYEWAPSRKIDPRGWSADGLDWWDGGTSPSSGNCSARQFRARLEDAMGMTPAQEQKLDRVLSLLDQYFGIDPQTGQAKDIRKKIDACYVELADEDHPDTLGGRLVVVERQTRRP